LKTSSNVYVYIGVQYIGVCFEMVWKWDLIHMISFNLITFQHLLEIHNVWIVLIS